MRCEECGIKIKKNYKLCPNCGKEVVIKPQEKKKSILNNKKYLSIFIVTIIVLLVGLFFLINSGSIKTIRKSVVKINVYDKSGEIIKTGSGFIAFDKNILITNAHVITGGYDADAVSESDERIYIKGVLYYNQDEDIAILKLNNQNNIKPLKISTEYDVGDEVIAIGSPLGIKNSVSDGIISNILTEENFIQHSAPISPGSSGGTLFDSKGRVIGMNTATMIEGQNINLAIPIEKIKKVYENSKNNKIQNINDAQYIVYKKVKTRFLNNQAGKNIIDIMVQNSNYKSIHNDDEYDIWAPNWLSELINSGDVSNGITLRAKMGFDETGKFHEPIVNEVVLIKVNNLSNEIVQQIEQWYLLISSNISSGSYIKATIPNPQGGGTVAPHYFSYEYINAAKNPTIGIYNNYVYMIICSDDKITKQIEEEIKKLP